MGPQEWLADPFGNFIAPPFDSAELTGFVPPRPARRRFELYQLLPALNRREDDTGDLRRFLACLQEVTDLLVHDVDRFTDILDPDLAPEPFLDVMLLDLAADAGAPPRWRLDTDARSCSVSPGATGSAAASTTCYRARWMMESQTGCLMSIAI